MTTAYVALGSNLGDRLANLAAAVAALSRVDGVRVLRCSRAYESEPWGLADQPPFANAVAVLECAIGPEELLAACQEIEARLGREHGERNGPRPIDLDILLFGRETRRAPALTIPHPRMLARDFVVTPLLEVAPDAALPDGTRVTAERAREGRVTGAIGAVPGCAGTVQEP